MNNVVIRDANLNGWEYGMLRSFENAIIKETDAKIIEMPKYNFATKYISHFGLGMKRGKYRKYLPKKAFNIESDVSWCVLMGPENYRLDLYKNWQSTSKVKILYLFDTLPGQYDLIKRLFGNADWDILITSFNDAVDDLEKLTNRKWYCVEQAADLSLFESTSEIERSIHFSSYGRRNTMVHEVLLEFCKSNNLYYDYTTHDAKHPIADSSELYRQYAWHISHSLFTLSWPVELTSPARAGHLNPITCRWFEAAASGTVIIGRQPDNATFNQVLEKDLIIDLNPNLSKTELINRLSEIWHNREKLILNASEASKRNSERWSWNERVNRIVSWL
jgi:hypothetical protein